jgi:PAS domain S-box-containing protein
VSDARARILLVDDRPENLLALEAILEPLGQELVRANSGEEALRRLLQHEFAVILLDVQMPGLDGFQTAELIKQRERTRHVPIIFLTAISKDAENVFRGYDAGAVDYLTKPFNPNVLRSKVAVFIELYEKTMELQRQQELLRAQELEALRHSESIRYRALAEAMPQIVWTSDATGAVDYLSQRWTDTTGQPSARALGWAWSEMIHPDDRARSLADWRRTVDARSDYENEIRFRNAADGTHRWHLVRARPTQDAGGEIVGWVGACTDIDDRKRDETAQRFLAEAGAALGSSLDIERTLADVARLAVPEIADWCVVDLLQGDSVQRVAVTHVDEAKLTLARELQQRFPPQLEHQWGAARVLRTGEPLLVPHLDAARLRSAGLDELQLEIVVELGLDSYMSVPMIARDEVVGALSFAAADSGRVYDEDDLAVVLELGRRAAIAVDNARLYRAAEERAQAARVLASIGDGVVLVDGAGCVRLWNEAADAITGVPGIEALGHQIESIVPGWGDVARRIPVARAGSVGSPESLPLDIGDRELWLSMSAVQLEDGVAYAFRDHTEERALDELKADFVATVSHELRTPLAAIYGSAQTIRRPDLELDDKIRNELLGVIATESDRLAAIVNDLLLASHLDSGRLPFQIERCDAVELGRAVIDSAKTHLPEGVALKLSAAKGTHVVAADPGQLRQVLVNLVENAIKYSPDGGTIDVAVRSEDGRVRFEVRDQGLGIPPGERRRIFEKFYRLDPHMSRGIGGTGLGLYICRELVRRVEGRIWVEGPANGGKGSTFIVDLPAAARSPGGKQRPRAQAAK